MLSKEHRLRKERDFDRVFKKGEKVFSHPFSLRCIDNGLPVSRFAVVVGGRVSKKAVERNRVRRRIREQIRPLLPSLRSGKDVSLSALPAAKGLSSAELGAALKKAFKKARLLV